jgi:hypothetical protein
VFAVLIGSLWTSITILPDSQQWRIFDLSNMPLIVGLLTASVGFRHAMAAYESGKLSELQSWARYLSSVAIGFLTSFVATQVMFAGSLFLFYLSFLIKGLSTREFLTTWLPFALVGAPLAATPEVLLFCLFFELLPIAMGMGAYVVLRRQRLAN